MTGSSQAAAPGQRQSSSSRDELWLGVAQADITPTEPVPLAGYAARFELGPASTVSARLRLRCLAFGSNATSSDRVLFVSADLLWWGDDLATELRHELAARYGLRPDAVVLHATHNHSGPQTSYRFTPLLGRPEPAYLEQLRAATLASAERALNSLVPVDVERMVTTADLAVDRRFARSAGAVPAGSVDDEVTVLRFTHRSRLVALLVHYTCHPVVHSANVVTSDFPGAAMDMLEARHPGAIAVFTQGCCGDVNPARYAADGAYLRGVQADIDEMGRALADIVDKVLDAPSSPAGRPNLWSDSYLVDVPVLRPPDTDELRELAERDGVLGQWAQILLRFPDRQRGTIPVRMTRFGLTDRLTFLGMAAEPVSAYGLFVKVQSAGATLPLGYTNGMAGYLVTTAQLAEGGYEADEAPYYFGMPGRLDQNAERELYRALAVASRSLPAPASTDGREVEP